MRLNLNVTRVAIYGRNLDNFLLKMQAKKVTLNQISRDEDSLSFSVSTRDYRKVKAYCKRAKIDLIPVVASPKKRAFGALISVLLLVTAVGFWACFGAWFSRKTMRVSVSVTNPNSSAAVIDMGRVQAITLEGIKAGLKLREVERSVLISVDGLSAVSITRRGNEYVVLLEKVAQVKVPENIVSRFNCKIKSLTLASGEALVRAGDMVRAGQMLVKSSTQNGRVVPAGAKIEADAWVIASVLFDENGAALVPTGRTQTTHTISIFGHKILPFSPCKFTYFTPIAAQKIITKNNFIPLVRETLTYIELELRPSRTDLVSALDDLKHQARECAKAMLPEGTTNFTETFIINTEGTKTKVDCYLKFAYNI